MKLRSKPIYSYLIFYFSAKMEIEWTLKQFRIYAHNKALSLMREN